MLDYLIKNAVVLDGTGKDRYAADIGIAGEHIKTIGHLEDVKAEEVIDATNMFVMPGIIDAVNHSDTHWTILEEPSQESLLRQGITTIIGGNCGSSLAPSIEIAALELSQDKPDVEKSRVAPSSRAEGRQTSRSVAIPPRLPRRYAPRNDTFFLSLRTK